MGVNIRAQEHSAESPARAHLPKVICIEGINDKRPSESRWLTKQLSANEYMEDHTGIAEVMGSNSVQA